MMYGALCFAALQVVFANLVRAQQVTGFSVEWTPGCNASTGAVKVVPPFGCTSGWSATGTADESVWYSFAEEESGNVDVFVFTGKREQQCQFLQATFSVAPSSCIPSLNITVGLEKTTCYAGQEGDKDVFSIPSQASNCSGSFQLCKSLFCSCIGTTAESCSISGLGDTPSQCSDVLEPCAVDYVQCMNNTYLHSNCDDSVPSPLTADNITSACLGYACELSDNSSCRLNASICEAAAPGSSDTIPATVVPWEHVGPGGLRTSVVATLLGDFSAFKSVSSSARRFHPSSSDNSSSQYDAFVKALESDLRSVLGVDVLVVNANFSDTSVQVTFFFVTPVAGATQRAVMSNVARLGKFPSSWLSSVLQVCQGGGGCSGGLVFGSLLSVSTVQVTLPTRLPSPVVAACSAGCIAGIIVAMVFVAVVISCLLHYFCFKARKRKEEKWNKAKQVIELEHVEHHPYGLPDAPEEPKESEQYEEVPQHVASPAGGQRPRVQWSTVFGSRRRMKAV